jgi:hypothetical protein
LVQSFTNIYMLAENRPMANYETWASCYISSMSKFFQKFIWSNKQLGDDIFHAWISYQQN